MKNQRGIAHWLVPLGILILIGLVGLFVVSHHKKAGAGGLFSKLDSPVSGQPDCSGKAGILQQSPVALSDLSTVVPLGNVAPPGHVIPTPHMYYNYIQTPGGHNLPKKTTLYAPADMTVKTIWLFDNASLAHPYNAYRIDFNICKQISGYFILILNLNDKLAAVMKPPYDRTQTSNVGTGIDHNYVKNVDVQLKAGEILGTAGGFENAPDGLDFGLTDSRTPDPTRANPDRWKDSSDVSHIVCSLDYYSTSLSNQLYNLLGSFNSIPKDPGSPRCGTIYQDVPGTAMGDWFSADSPVNVNTDVDSQLALISWNLDHSKRVISAGNKIKQVGLSSNAVYSFSPVENGNVNLDFNLVKPGGVYCYNVADSTQTDNTQIAVLIQMTNKNTLKIGKLAAGSCGSGPWSFSSSLTYNR